MTERKNDIVISDQSVNRLVGKILTHIEVLGLKESQEKAVKDLIRNEIYNLTSSSWDAQYIPSSLGDRIREDFRIYERKQDKASREGTNPPPSPWEAKSFEITVSH